MSALIYGKMAAIEGNGMGIQASSKTIARARQDNRVLFAIQYNLGILALSQHTCLLDGESVGADCSQMGPEGVVVCVTTLLATDALQVALMIHMSAGNFVARRVVDGEGVEEGLCVVHTDVDFCGLVFIKASSQHVNGSEDHGTGGNVIPEPAAVVATDECEAGEASGSERQNGQTLGNHAAHGMTDDVEERVFTEDVISDSEGVTCHSVYAIRIVGGRGGQ